MNVYRLHHNQGRYRYYQKSRNQIVTKINAQLRNDNFTCLIWWSGSPPPDYVKIYRSKSAFQNITLETEYETRILDYHVTVTLATVKTTINHGLARYAPYYQPAVQHNTRFKTLWSIGHRKHARRHAVSCRPSPACSLQCAHTWNGHYATQNFDEKSFTSHIAYRQHTNILLQGPLHAGHYRGQVLERSASCRDALFTSAASRIWKWGTAAAPFFSVRGATLSKTEAVYYIKSNTNSQIFKGRLLPLFKMRGGGSRCNTGLPVTIPGLNGWNISLLIYVL